MSILGRITSFIKTEVLGIEETNNTQKPNAAQPQKEAIIQCNTDKPEDRYQSSGKTIQKGQGKGMTKKAAEEAIANTPSEKFDIHKMLEEGLLEKIFGEAGSKKKFDKLTPKQKQLAIRAIQNSIATFEKMMEEGTLSSDANPEELVAVFGKILYDAVNSGSFNTIEEFKDSIGDIKKELGEDYNKLSPKEQRTRAVQLRHNIDQEMQAELDAIKNLPKKQRKIEEERIYEKYNHGRNYKLCLATAQFDSEGALYATRILTSDNLTRGMNILFSTRKDKAERTRTADMANYNFTKELISDYKEFNDEIKPASLKAYTATTMSYKSSDAVTEYQANYKADRDKYEAALIKQRNGEHLTEDDKALLSLMSSEYYTATAQGIGEGALHNVNMTSSEKASFLNQWEKDAKQYSDYEVVTSSVKNELENNPEHSEIKTKIEEIKQQEKTGEKPVSKKPETQTTNPKTTVTSPYIPQSKPSTTEKKTEKVKPKKNNEPEQVTTAPTVRTTNPIVIAQEIKDNGAENAIKKYGSDAIQMILDNSSFKHLRPQLATIIRSSDLKTLTEMTSKCSDSAFIYVCSIVNKDFIIKLKENREHTRGLCFAAEKQVKNIEGEHETV